MRFGLEIVNSMESSLKSRSTAKMEILWMASRKTYTEWEGSGQSTLENITIIRKQQIQ